MPVPRRFDRRPPERDTTRINERIRVPEVRLIDDEGNQIGVLKTADALAFAQERDLDLVEVAPEAKPPVCRVLDYSKYKYEQAQKQKQARKHQQQITIREIKFRPKIAQHDYDTKKHHVERFLRHKDKVKVTIMFRGREVTHPERGTAILDRLAEELAELGHIFCEPFEQRPTALGMAHLAPAEHDRDLDLVALAQEAYDMALLGGVVVGIDLGAELDLLDRDRALVLARQLLLLLLVVAVLAVVHDPADGRIGLVGNLDQIEVEVASKGESLGQRLDADLFPVGPDESDLPGADPIVDPRLVVVRWRSYGRLLFMWCVGPP